MPRNDQGIPVLQGREDVNDTPVLTEPAPVPDGVGPRRFSVSQANLFDKCPRRWWWRYIAGLPDPPGPEARRGTLVHAVLEHLCQLPPEQRTFSAAGRIIFDHVTPDDPAELRRAAWRNITRAIRLPGVVAADVLATEYEFVVDLGGVPFKGYIDRVIRNPDGRIEIDDYKDGRRRTDDRSKAEKRRQIILYAAAHPLYQEQAGQSVEEPKAASLIYTAAEHIDRYPVTAAAVRSATGWLKGVWDDLQSARASGEFPVRPSPLCSWCPAVGHCPAGLDAVRARARNPDKSLGDHGRRALAVSAESAA